jgi:hypothetical protein
MKSCVALASLVAFVALIQPCPAPPLAIAIAGAGLAGAAVGGGLALGGAAIGANAGKNSGKRDTTNPHEVSVCMADALSSAPPHVEIMSDSSVMVHGMPPSCMVEVEAYNRHPQIEQLNFMYGGTTIMNETSVRLSGLPDFMVDTMGQLAKEIAARGIVYDYSLTRRTLRFERN